LDEEPAAAVVSLGVTVGPRVGGVKLGSLMGGVVVVTKAYKLGPELGREVGTVVAGPFEGPVEGPVLVIVSTGLKDGVTYG
jgi:hypothetical protein